MSYTPAEDYEIRCEDEAREIVRSMEGLREVSFEDSQADEYEGDDWYWSGTMVLTMEHRNRVYRIPVFSRSQAGEVEFGDTDTPWGDTEQVVWRSIWIDEVERAESERGTK